MDGINNNFNNYHNSFSGINKDSREVDKNSQMKKIADNCQKAINNLGDKYVSDNGKFEKFNISFDIPQTNYQGIVTIEADRKEPNLQRRLSVKIHNKHSDRMFSNYLMNGTKKEIFEYSKKDEFKESFLNSVTQLLKSADDYYSTL